MVVINIPQASAVSVHLADTAQVSALLASLDEDQLLSALQDLAKNSQTLTPERLRIWTSQLWSVSPNGESQNGLISPPREMSPASRISIGEHNDLPYPEDYSRRIAQDNAKPLPELPCIWSSLPNQLDDDFFTLPKAKDYRDDKEEKNENQYTRTRHARKSVAPRVFEDAVTIKNRVKEFLETKPVYRVEDFYKPGSFWTKVAISPWFDNGTLALVAFNSLWMWIDTDNNKAETLLDAEPVFFTFEQFFCFAFTTELVIRFMAFQRTCSALKDPWFVFDFALVSMMVGETWVLTLVMYFSGNSSSSSGIGDAAVLRLGKMLRLLRMMRIARLMRSMPEFFILVKALSSSARATLFTLLFLAILMYVYGIAFVQMMQGTASGATYFPDVPTAMFSLFLYGALLDEVSGFMADIGEDSAFCLVLVFSYVLVAAITLMNILIGVLCEAISAVADSERLRLQVETTEETLQLILLEEDTNHDGYISKSELQKLLSTKTAVLALESIGIDVLGLVDAADAIFSANQDDYKNFNTEIKLPFDEFMEVLLKLRGENKAKVKDIVDLKQLLNKLVRTQDKMRNNLDSFIASAEANHFLGRISDRSDVSRNPTMQAQMVSTVAPSKFVNMLEDLV
eukprot:TRINITY_DN14345_c0_g2_i8.p1 TRINITY_DN14345_c0_g2~~TRINITY_DN14345_c0_g2_i8.p1  ORF type:complete len:626 (+),score=117.50 TRINITY_DN14345_c0_g2_i8:79-1956(+)